MEKKNYPQRACNICGEMYQPYRLDSKVCKKEECRKKQDVIDKAEYSKKILGVLDITYNGQVLKVKRMNRGSCNNCILFGKHYKLNCEYPEYRQYKERCVGCYRLVDKKQKIVDKIPYHGKLKTPVDGKYDLNYELCLPNKIMMEH